MQFRYQWKVRGSRIGRQLDVGIRTSPLSANLTYHRKPYLHQHYFVKSDSLSDSLSDSYEDFETMRDSQAIFPFLLTIKKTFSMPYQATYIC